MLLAQAISCTSARTDACTPTPWKAKWFDVDVPALLQQKNFLYLSLDAQSAAFLAPFLNSDSSFVNLVGQSSLALDRPGGERLRSLLDRHRPDIRTLILIRAQTETGEPHPVIFPVQDSMLERVGLRSDPNECLVIVMRDVVVRRVLIPSGSELPKAGFVPDDTQFLSCATMPVRADRCRVASRGEARAGRSRFRPAGNALPEAFQPGRHLHRPVSTPLHPELRQQRCNAVETEVSFSIRAGGRVLPSSWARSRYPGGTHRSRLSFDFPAVLRHAEVGSQAHRIHPRLRRVNLVPRATPLFAPQTP